MINVKIIGFTPEAEKIIEEAGRTAYLSFDKKSEFPILRISSGVNEKLLYTENYPEFQSKQVGDSFEFEGDKWTVKKRWENTAAKFIEMLIHSGHHSVLEHSYATFRVRGGSRAFTHQLVRHRLAAFTQQSQRYVNERNFNYVTPPSIEKNPEAKIIFEEFIDYARETYSKLRNLKIKKEDARFVLPNAVESEIVISANLREWRHILELRGHPTAQWEIRTFAVAVAKELKKLFPAVFFDFRIDEEKSTVVKIED